MIKPKVAVFGLVLFLAGCSGGPSLVAGALASCQGLTNCLSSAESDNARYITPFTFDGTTQEAISQIESVLSAEGAKLDAATDSYVKAHYSILGIPVVYAEFLFGDGVADVRFSSPYGFDLGETRRRHDKLFEELTGLSPEEQRKNDAKSIGLLPSDLN